MFSEEPVVEREEDDEGDRAEADRVELHPEAWTRMAAAVGQGHIGRAVNHRQAEPCQQEDGAQQQPVDVEIEAALEHGGYCPSGPASARANRSRRSSRMSSRDGAGGSGRPSFFAK